MANIRAYAQMVDKAEEVGWPTMYETDLYVIDRALLEWDCAPRTFGWVLRDSGTHIIRTREDYLTAEYWGKEGRLATARCYWYDGDNLKEITYQELLSYTRERLPYWTQVGPHISATQYRWWHNRIEQLRVLEDARRGRSRDYLTLTVPNPYVKAVEANMPEEFRWPYISGLEHTSQKYGNGYKEMMARIERERSAQTS